VTLGIRVRVRVGTRASGCGRKCREFEQKKQDERISTARIGGRRKQTGEVGMRKEGVGRRDDGKVLRE
jgi:hypothetical protein